MPCTTSSTKIFVILLSIIFLILNIHAHILRLPCLTYGNFSIVRSGHRLSTGILETFTDLSEDECKEKCVQHRMCKSINKKETSGIICELISQSTEDPFDNVALVVRSKWTYKTTDYEAKAIGPYCEYNNFCQDYLQATCIDTCSSPGYTCEKMTSTSFKHCQDVYAKGKTVTGIYPIQINDEEVYVRCDMETDGGGWIVFQRRVDASVDFNRNWNEYKKGFGDLNGNFWLGFDKIHKLAAPGKSAILRVDLKHLGVGNFLIYAQYSTFEISGEDDNYKLKVDGFIGTASDSLEYHNGLNFTTKDRDNDYCVNDYENNCALQFKGPWWYGNGYRSALNNRYPWHENEDPNFISWLYRGSIVGKVRFVEMKLRYTQAAT